MVTKKQWFDPRSHWPTQILWLSGEQWIETPSLTLNIPLKLVREYCKRKALHWEASPAYLFGTDTGGGVLSHGSNGLSQMFNFRLQVDNAMEKCQHEAPAASMISKLFCYMADSPRLYASAGPDLLNTTKWKKKTSHKIRNSQK